MTGLYGRTHRELRARLRPTVETGTVRCASGSRCKHADGQLGGFIAPGAPWDLGHDDRDPTRWIGPQHPECNRATFGRGESRRRPDPPHPGSVL